MDARPSPRSPGADPARVVALLLAGLTTEADAAARLGIGVDELRRLLWTLDLDQVAAVPVGIEGRSVVRYLDAGRSSFAAALFDDVVEDRWAKGDVLRFTLPVARLLGAGEGLSPWRPDGIILHTGRSGSTLLCNLLAGLGGWAVLQEPELVNMILRNLAGAGDRRDRQRWGDLATLVLRSLARGARLDAHGGERPVAVKLTSWNALVAGQLLPELGRVPLIGLVRDPWASVESLLDDPPYWYAPPSGPGRPGTRWMAVRRLATVWSRTVEALLGLPADRCLLVTYDALAADPVASLRRVSVHLGHERAAPDVDAAGRIARIYSKSAGTEPFEPRGRHARRPLDRRERDVVTEVSGEGWATVLERANVSVPDVAPARPTPPPRWIAAARWPEVAGSALPVSLDEAEA